MSAPIPRKPRLSRAMARDQHRIRRLEVNRSPGPQYGQAFYDADYSSAGVIAGPWSPDLSLLVVSGLDSIGCVPNLGELQVPNGWIWWATVTFDLTFNTAPPTGEAVQWGGEDSASARADVAVPDVTLRQTFSVTVASASMGFLTGPILSDVVTSLGTEFTPGFVTMNVMGIYLGAGQSATPPLIG